MRTIAGCFASLAAVGAVAVAAAQVDPARVVHLRGYYQLNFSPTWRLSDRSPWYLLRSASWADQRLLKWGYVPAEHDGKRFMCLIDDQHFTGSRLPPGPVYICGDPGTAEMLYNRGWTPVLRLYGGGLGS